MKPYAYGHEAVCVKTCIDTRRGCTARSHTSPTNSQHHSIKSSPKCVVCSRSIRSTTSRGFVAYVIIRIESL